MATLLVKMERSKHIDAFIGLRSRFEDFLVLNRPLLNQVIRKFGTKDSGARHLTEFYEFVLLEIAKGGSIGTIVAALVAAKNFSYIQPAETPYDGAPGAKFSNQVKSGAVMSQLLPTALRCAICKGYLPTQAISIDHVERRSAGGSSAATNAAVAHPYCNTTYKG